MRLTKEQAKKLLNDTDSKYALKIAGYLNPKNLHSRLIEEKNPDTLFSYLYIDDFKYSAVCNTLMQETTKYNKEDFLAETSQWLNIELIKKQNIPNNALEPFMEEIHLSRKETIKRFKQVQSFKELNHLLTNSAELYPDIVEKIKNRQPITSMAVDYRSFQINESSIVHKPLNELGQIKSIVDSSFRAKLKAQEEVYALGYYPKHSKKGIKITLEALEKYLPYNTLIPLHKLKPKLYNFLKSQDSSLVNILNLDNATILNKYIKHLCRVTYYNDAKQPLKKRTKSAYYFSTLKGLIDAEPYIKIKIHCYI